MRQQSVQQQNAVAQNSLRVHAKYWRNTPLPPALIEAASARGVDCATAIFLKLEIDFPGMPRLFGVMLTSSERFIRFEIETDEMHSSVELVEVWRDVTENQNINVRNRGIGVGAGASAIEVLRELNADA
jgi:hypothetical protein